MKMAKLSLSKNFSSTEMHHDNVNSYISSSKSFNKHMKMQQKKEKVVQETIDKLQELSNTLTTGLERAKSKFHELDAAKRKRLIRAGIVLVGALGALGLLKKRHNAKLKSSREED